MKITVFPQNVFIFPIHFLQYIIVLLLSLPHELGHAKCILNIAKHKKLYKPNEYVVITFGDYKNGKLLFSRFYPYLLCPKKESDIRVYFFSHSPKERNPITLTSYYAKFNRAEIVACAKAGYEAELHRLYISTTICLFLLIALIILKCLFVFILFLFYIFIIFIRWYSCKQAWSATKQKKNGYYIRNDYYFAQCPNSFNKKRKSHTYYKFIRKYP